MNLRSHFTKNTKRFIYFTVFHVTIATGNGHKITINEKLQSRLLNRLFATREVLAETDTSHYLEYITKDS